MHDKFISNFSEDVHTKYIDNITGKYTSNFCMFKAECYLNNIKYNCERVNINGKNGLYFTTNNNKNIIKNGFNIEAEDPRIFIFNNKVYVVFICLSPYLNQKRCIGITEFNKWNPVFLQIQNMKHTSCEKNWAPFIKDNKLYFVYNYDPLIIIHYNFNNQGICNVIFKQNNINLPFDGQSETQLRGGSNLQPYKDDYYIGACHSKVSNSNMFMRYSSHIILLDVKQWRLVYLSKPIMFNYYKNDLKTHNTILIENGIEGMKFCKNFNIIIQSPVSLYIKNDKYFITVNVRDYFTLLYEIEFKSILNLKENNIKKINYWNNLTYNYNIYETKYKCIHIGSSRRNRKVIKLNKKFLPDIKLKFIHKYKDKFKYHFNNNKLIIRRIDKPTGWGQDLIGYLCIHIGSSITNTKIIKLNNIYSIDKEFTELKFIHKYKDKFKYNFINNKLIIRRIDKRTGWGQDLYGYIKTFK